MDERQYSRSPDGDDYPIPTKEEGQIEFEKLKKIVDEQQQNGKEIVVVMGVGFVGIVMAAVVADSHDENGNYNKFVIGMQRPSTRSYWKIPVINKGLSPVKSEDPEVDVLITRSVVERKNLIATYVYDVLKLADVVVVDVQCDYLKEDLGNVRTGHADVVALEKSIEIIADRIPVLPVVVHSFGSDYSSHPSNAGITAFVEKSGNSVEQLKKVIFNVLREAIPQGPDAPEDGKEITTEL